MADSGENNEGQDLDLEAMMTPSNLNELDEYFGSLGVQVNDYPGLPGSIPEPQPELVPEMDLIVVNRMIRLRYDSELSNRNKGKEELIRIKIKNYRGPVWIRMQTVDISNHKAHPFSLIGDFCDNEIYFNKFEIDHFDTNGALCVCKATLRIPKKQDYENVLQKKHQAYKDNMFGIFLDEMKSGDYWTCNKSLKDCTDFRLHVEAFYEIEPGNYGHLHKVSDTLVNAKDGKSFEVHRVIPYAVSVDGIRDMQHSLVIILTADSYVPKKIKVIFTDNEGWKETASHANVIKNVIECTVPAYKDRNITQPKKVSIVVEDTQKKMSTGPRDMEYTISMADMDTTERKRKKPTPTYNVPEQLQSSIRTHTVPNTSTQSATSTTSRIQLKGKLRQKCKGPENHQPNMPNLTSVPRLIVRGPGAAAPPSTVSMATLQSLSTQNQPSHFTFSAIDNMAGQSVANILAPSGAQITLGDNNQPKDFCQKYIQEASKEQQQSAFQQQQIQLLQLTQQQHSGQQNQQHSLLIGSQDSSLYNSFQHQQQQMTQSHPYLPVNPTTLQPQSSGNSDLDFFDDIDVDSATPDKREENKKMTPNKDKIKITNISGGSGEKIPEDVSKGEKNKEVIQQREEISKELQKSKTEPDVCSNTKTQKSVKTHTVCTAKTLDKNQTEVKRSESSNSKVTKSDQNQISKSNLENMDKNQTEEEVRYQGDKDIKVSAKNPKSESLDCKELEKALPSDDLESDALASNDLESDGC